MQNSGAVQCDETVETIQFLRFRHFYRKRKLQVAGEVLALPVTYAASKQRPCVTPCVHLSASVGARTTQQRVMYFHSDQIVRLLNCCRTSSSISAMSVSVAGWWLVWGHSVSSLYPAKFEWPVIPKLSNFNQRNISWFSNLWLLKHCYHENGTNAILQLFEANYLTNIWWSSNPKVSGMGALCEQTRPSVCKGCHQVALLRVAKSDHKKVKLRKKGFS